MSTPLDRAPDERLQNSDKEAEIERYYELLSSGHSVGEILNAVGPAQSKSECGDTATAGQPQSGLDGVASDITAEVAVAEAALADATYTRGLNIRHKAESFRTGKPEAPQSALSNEPGSAN